MATSSASTDPTIERLEDQIDWYDRKSMRCQKIFKRLKVIEIVAAALIPVIATAKLDYRYGITSANLSAALGVLITVLEGILQLNQYQSNWITYRSTCEALKHEKYVYLGKASPYSDVADPHALLAERIESIVSQEHAKWASTSAAKPSQKP